MPLYDIIDDIAEKQILKTDTGDNRIFGVVLGVVAKNYDEKMPGRVCVTITNRDAEANELKWARVAMPSSGASWGHYFLPEVGDQVLLAFEQGNIEKPYVIGCIPKDADKFLKSSVHEKNQNKRIVTKNGNSIDFIDNPEGEGAKDKILISTAKSDTVHQRIELDNEKQTILISDVEGKNRILMNTEKGEMTIDLEKKLTLNVGSIKLVMDGDNGKTTLTTSTLTVDCDKAINMTGTSSVKIDGGNIQVASSSSLKLGDNGPVTIAGAPINIG